MSYTITVSHYPGSYDSKKVLEWFDNAKIEYSLHDLSKDVDKRTEFAQQYDSPTVVVEASFGPVHQRSWSGWKHENMRWVANNAFLSRKNFNTVP